MDGYPLEMARALELASQLIANGKENLPVDVHFLARTLGVRRIEPRFMQADGYLGRTASGELVIRFRADQSRTRTRFTIAHEVAHILLAEVQGKSIKTESFRSEKGSDVEELAVNRIAAELLIPRSAMESHFKRLQVSWNSVYRLCRLFDVSTSALLRRILEIPGVPSFWMQVPIHESTAPKKSGSFRLVCSRSPRLMFAVAPRQLGQILVTNTLEGKPNCAKVFADDRVTVLPVASRLMDAFGPREYWFVAWESGDMRWT